MKAVFLQDKSTGQYVVDTGDKLFACILLGLVPEKEKATEFTLKNIPGSPDGVFIAKDGGDMVFNYASTGDYVNSKAVCLYPLHSGPPQQFTAKKDAEGIYQIQQLKDPKNHMYYDPSRKTFTMGPFVAGYGFRLVEKDEKKPHPVKELHHINTHHDSKCCDESSSSDHH